MTLEQLVSNSKRLVGGLLAAGLLVGYSVDVRLNKEAFLQEARVAGMHVLEADNLDAYRSWMEYGSRSLRAAEGWPVYVPASRKWLLGERPVDRSSFRYVRMK